MHQLSRREHLHGKLSQSLSTLIIRVKRRLSI
jgi:hypothetical protein